MTNHTIQMYKNLFLALLLFVVANCKTSEATEGQNQPEEYTFVTYNVENLFDADGIAEYDDYSPTDRDGNPQYSKEDVLTKVQNVIKVMQQYNEGKGPDIIAFVELESDFTPSSSYADAGDFLGQFAHTTLSDMLGPDFNEKVADLPSEWLLLKGMVDAGMWNYQVEVGYPPMENGKPTTVQKTAVFSRFPVLREKTEIHPLVRARSILEAHIDVEGNELVVFANHWKSGAGSAEMEEVRLQNAQVLRDRLDALVAENPEIDFILAGDFNSDYNQKARYNFPKTAINDVLGSSGNEICFMDADFKGIDGLEAMKQACTPEDFVYNLWYELDLNQRGSDSYRGKWGTLMQIMLSPGMRSFSGLQYVDDSYEVGDFGFNTFSSSREPKRWSSTFTGSGYSDHLPVSMRFTLDENKNGLVDLSANDDELWKPISLEYHIPTEYKTEEVFTAVDPTQSPEFFNEYFYLSGTVTDDFDFVVNGTTFDVYAPSFRLNEKLGNIAGTDTEINFYGRFSQYRGRWQFVVESPDFIEINE